MSEPRLIVRVRYDGQDYIWSSGDEPQHLQSLINNLTTALHESQRSNVIAQSAQPPIIVANPS